LALCGFAYFYEAAGVVTSQYVDEFNEEHKNTLGDFRRIFYPLKVGFSQSSKRLDSSNG
jgi:hypothetical protein